MIGRLLLSLCLSGAVAAIAAQQVTTPAAPPAGKGVIVGTVVDAVTNEPIPNVTVTVSADGNRTRSTVVADDKGRYVFSDAPTGHLMLMSALAGSGYMNGYYGTRSPFSANQFFDLANGETATGVVIRMWKNAIVTGTVTDDKGDPVVGASVMASRVEMNGGRTTFSSGRQIKTDDRGTYRIVDLVPTEYAVVLVSPAAVAGASTAQSASGYPTLYYPDATSTSNATVLKLAGGEERTGIDFHVARRPVFSVSGTLSGRLEGQTRAVQLKLRPADAGQIPSTVDVRRASTDAQGRFTFPAVLPGSYAIDTIDVPAEPVPSGTSRMSYQSTGTGFMMTGGNIGGRGPALPLAPLPSAAIRWASTPVTVDDKNVDDVSVALQSSGSIKGRIVFEGSADKPSAEVLAQTGVMALMTDGRDLGMLPATGIRADGSFETAGLPPGSYQLMVMLNVPPWTMGSMTVNGAETIGRPLTAGASDLTGVVMRFLDHPTQIVGVVHGDTGAPSADATIYIFPADRSAWSTGGFGSQLREVRPSRTGSYQAGVIAGEYLVAAVEATAREDWRRADVLDGLARTAKSVKVTMGQTVTVDVTVPRGK